MGTFNFFQPNIWKLAEKKDVTRLIKLLKHKNPDYRRVAACALGEIVAESAVEPLINTLEDEHENSEVRAMAARSLGIIGDKKAVEPLIKALDNNYVIRNEAVSALGKVGNKNAIEPLVQVLKEKPLWKDVREALEKLGWKPRNETEKVYFLIAMEQWDEIANLGESSVEPFIQALENHPGLITEKAIMNKLVELGEPSIELLIKVLSDDYARESAVTALRNIGNKKAVEPLIQALKGEINSNVRKKEIEALEKLGWKPRDETEKVYFLIAMEQWDEIANLGESSVEPLIMVLGDIFSEYEAIKILIKMGEPAVEPLIKALKHKDWHIQSGAAEILGEIGDKRAIEPLQQILKESRDSFAHEKVEEALIKLGEPVECNRLTIATVSCGVVILIFAFILKLIVGGRVMALLNTIAIDTISLMTWLAVHLLWYILLSRQ